MISRLFRAALALLCLLGLAAPVSAASIAEWRGQTPDSRIELVVSDLYSPHSADVNLNDAVINHTDYAVIVFYADAGCTEKAEALQTLAADTRFWARAEVGSWRGEPQGFTVFVSPAALTLTARAGDSPGTVRLSAALAPGARRRFPTGEVTFWRENERLGTVRVRADGTAEGVFAVPDAEAHRFAADYTGDESYSYASAACTADGGFGTAPVWDAAAVLAAFEPFFENRLAAVYLGEPVALPAARRVATPDPAGFDPGPFDGDGEETLHFYLYDPALNRYAETAGFIDADGRVNVITDRGGWLVVSEGPLTRKAG